MPGSMKSRHAAAADEAATTEKAVIAVGPRGIIPKDFDELWRMSDMIAKSGLAPQGMDASQCMVAIQTGLEVGLTPLAALRSVYVVNNRPSWYGKAALGLVRASGLLLKCSQQSVGPPPNYDEGLKGFDDSFGIEVTLQRKGEPLQKFTFTVGQAKLAKLWNKRGRNDQPTPWVTHPERMLYWRALGQGLDELFSDVTGGLQLMEVVRDYEPDARVERDVTPRGAPTPTEAADDLLDQLADGDTDAPARVVKEPTDAELTEIEIEEDTILAPVEGNAQRYYGSSLPEVQSPDGATSAEEAFGKQRRQPGGQIEGDELSAPMGEKTSDTPEPTDPEAPKGCDHMLEGGETAWVLTENGDDEPIESCSICGTVYEEPQQQELL